MNDKVLFRPEDLQAIDATVYEPKREELMGRTVLSLKTDIAPGAEQYGYNVMNRSGVAKILGNNADDIPLVSADLKREFQRIYSIVVAFDYTIQEIRAAQMAGTTIDTMKAAIARRAIAEKENKLIWIGDADYNIKGIANATGIQVEEVADGAASATEWASKTPDEIVEDVRVLRSRITVLPGHGESANLYLMLPPAQYEILNKNFGQFDRRSIMAVIRENNWFAGIVRVPDLAGVGAGGSDAMLIADTSPEVMQLLLPMDIMMHEQEYKFPRYKFPLEERCGGVVLRYPMAVSRGDGI